MEVEVIEILLIKSYRLWICYHWLSINFLQWRTKSTIFVQLRTRLIIRLGLESLIDDEYTYNIFQILVFKWLLPLNLYSRYHYFIFTETWFTQLFSFMRIIPFQGQFQVERQYQYVYYHFIIDSSYLPCFA